MMSEVFLNGEFVAERDARVGVDDGGWLHGAGLFETMRAESGRVFRLELHMQRLMRSAIRLLRPIEREFLPRGDDFRALLERRGLTSARVRMTVTAGAMRAAPDGIPARPNVCVTAAELTTYPAKLYEDGVRVVVSSARTSPSDPLAGHKTTCFLPRLIALREAQSARCTEALWFTTGNHLAEGSISNVFLVSGGALRTPPLDTPVLPGIARAVVLQLARDRDLPLAEIPITIDDLLDADEIFLTNTMMQVMPVVGVEKHEIGDGRVGPIASELRRAFRELLETECANS